MTSRRIVIALAITAAVLGAPARGDVVTLKNGNEVRGRVLEDGADQVRVRTDGGIITFRRSEVASVKIDGADDGSRRTPRPVEPTPPTEPTRGRPVRSGEAWTWAPGISPQRIAELTPVRDRLLAQLAALGPTREKRLEALLCTPEERAELQALIQDFDDIRRRGNAAQRRNAARDEAARFGMKALPLLVEGLASGSHWTRRMSAQALQQLMLAPGGTLTADDARWLMYDQGVVDRLMAMLQTQGDPEAAFIRAETASVLAKVSGQAIPYPQGSTEPSPTPAEVAAAQAWTSWWKRAAVEWRRAKDEKEQAHTDLLRKLDAVREGRSPE